MSVDKLVDSTQLDADLTSVADAIRAKSGGSGQLAFPAGFVSEIGNIPSGGGVTPGEIMGEILAETPTFPSGDLVVDITRIGQQAFSYDKRGPYWRLFAPNVTFVDQNAFRESATLQEAHFPNLTSYGSTSYIFYAAASGTRPLRLIDWGKANVPGNWTTNCVNLKTIILRKQTIASLSNTNSFANTPFKSGGSGGTIYIPKVLYDHLGDGSSLDYKAATNWSTIDGYGTITWAQIEGSEYEL